MLLILAGVAISLTIGQNGIFARAEQAVNIYEKATANEQSELDKVTEIIDGYLPSDKLTIGSVYQDSMIGQSINYSANGQNDWIILGKDSGGNVLITTSKPITETLYTPRENTMSSWLFYEEDINAQIKELQEKLKKSKEVSEKAAEVEDLLPGILKNLGMEVSKTTYVLNEDDVERPKFVISAKPLKKLRVKDNHYASGSSRDKAYERALAKTGVLSSSVQFAFKEKGLDVTANFNPYNLMYENESEMNKDIIIDVFVK